MASNIITIELAGEDRARIDRLTELLEQSQPGQLVGNEIPSTGGAALTADIEVEESEQPTYTAADIQAKVQKLASPATGKREAVKQIVNAYASRVSGIPEDKYPEVMAKLIALEEGRA